ncbi:tyrosine-type recombinase/integrase [Bacillus thuringiensis]
MKIDYHVRNYGNFHGLRHTSATLLLEAGENMKVISSRLGHSRINATIDIYTHSLQSADQGASNKLDALITPNNMLSKTKLDVYSEASSFLGAEMGQNLAIMGHLASFYFLYH